MYCMILGVDRGLAVAGNVVLQSTHCVGCTHVLVLEALEVRCDAEPLEQVSMAHRRSVVDSICSGGASGMDSLVVQRSVHVVLGDVQDVLIVTSSVVTLFPSAPGHCSHDSASVALLVVKSLEQK